MQVEKATQHCDKSNQNYHFYITLEPGNYLELILFCLLDDGITHCRLTNATLPQSCVNLFGDVNGLYQFLQENGSNPSKVSVSDIGTVILIDQIPTKSKLVKVNAQFPTQKVYEQQLLAQFYLKIIKLNQIQPEPEPIKDTKTKIIKRNRQFNKIQLTVDMQNNPFLKCYSKKGNQIKIQEYVNKRIKLYFKEVFAKGKCSYITLRIVNSKTGNFGFGIMDRKQQREDKSFYSLCYDFSTGDLKDSNFVKDAKQTKWRKVGAPIPHIKNAIMKIQLNYPDQRVAFYCNNEWVCQTVIPNYLMKADLIGYLSIKHQGDQFLLNDE